MALNIAKLIQNGMKTAARMGVAAASGVQLTRTTKGTYDPATDKTTAGTTATYDIPDVTVGAYRAPSGTYQGESFEANTLRVTNGRTLTFAAADCQVTPALGDQYKFDDATWTTLYVESENPTGTQPLAWIVGVMK